MSNGTPDPREGGPEGPPGPIVVGALVYIVLWILGAFASLFVDMSVLVRVQWLFWLSIALLLASLFVVAREMGFIGPHAGPRR